MMFELRCGEETEPLMSKLNSFDKVLSDILKSEVRKISACFFFNQKNINWNNVEFYAKAKELISDQVCP